MYFKYYNCQKYFSGFSPLHYAAAWGRISNIKVLIEFNCNLQQKNVHNERPRETAVRYNQTECVDFLDWAGRYFNFLHAGYFLHAFCYCFFFKKSFKKYHQNVKQ